jgi:hypothetical protein
LRATTSVQRLGDDATVRVKVLDRRTFLVSVRPLIGRCSKRRLARAGEQSAKYKAALEALLGQAPARGRLTLDSRQRGERRLRAGGAGRRQPDDGENHVKAIHLLSTANRARP